MKTQLRESNLQIQWLSKILIGMSLTTSLICQAAHSENTDTSIYYCEVVNIARGQLSLRAAPNGRTIAGLNNGDIVILAGKSRSLLNNGVLAGRKYRGNLWVQVLVKTTANSKLSNKTGYVNGQYLSCR
jgi:hypothetical protein